MSEQKKARQLYFVGGGLASLAGAVYALRDCGFKGEQIHILEGLPILGGSNDGIGTPEKGFVCRGGRMLNEETYENFWELFSGIPSLKDPNTSVTEEILAFDHAHPTNAKARLIDKNGKILNAHTMGFDGRDRRAMLKLLRCKEESLDNKTIADWFEPHFFETNFWYMWQTTFAFQSWSSLFEFRRYMLRMMFEYSRIDTLEGVTRTPLNQYDSVILPIKNFAEKQGVDFSLRCTVTDLDFEESSKITVTAIHYTDENGPGLLQLKEGDLCIVTNGCMTDCSSLGNFDTPASFRPEKPISGELWKKIALKKPGLGNPDPFFSKPEETNWESFTVTLNGNKLLKKIEAFSSNVPGSGALMTFKDSSWRMSLVVAAQPHFANQPKDQTIFWAYGLFTDKIGDYVKKPMRDCTGKELFMERLYHFHWIDEADEILKDVVNVVPCMMPYIDAQFQPRAMSDRPKVVPEGSENFACISQFVEIPQDMVFTEEYSVRAARIALYTLLKINKKICPVTPYSKRLGVLLNAAKTSYR